MIESEKLKITFITQHAYYANMQKQLCVWVWVALNNNAMESHLSYSRS
jgi:hypothetical protein